MFKNALFIKTVCGVTIYSFVLASMPQNARAWGLPPESFNKMYSLAQRGDVEALRASVYRGLNIDSVNKSGDTGLCVAARRRDTYTYNAFRAAGANPRHPCTQRIDGYSDFVEGSSAVPAGANAREAYSAIGREKYKIAPWVWWTGGALLVGGVALAIALGGGGGGKGGSSAAETEAYNSLGVHAGTKAKIVKKSSTDTTNSAMQRHSNSNTGAVADIDYNSNVLKNSEYVDILFKAEKGATYVNAADTPLYIGLGTIAMDAVNKSAVVNNGYINIDTYNASIGMVASESSSAVNNGATTGTASTNGIDMNFSGTKNSDTLIGMYADTNSTITNNGEIRGTATLAGEATSIAGSMVGMEAMIINVGKDLNKDTINVINTDMGKINLSAGDGNAGAETEVTIELLGMSSYLDYDFLNGSKNINRAENALLNNRGDINLNYTGRYKASTDNALRQGLGGVVGMRADANTNAINNGNIAVTLNDDGSGSAVDVAAGMQSVHGGKITNSSKISVTSPSSNNRINYGMLSVEGSGTVSSLYTGLIPVLTNDENGIISMQVSNSYGMASYNSGSLINQGKIVLGADSGTNYTNNIAMYANGVRTPYATLTNTGSIDIYSHNSMAMQNDFGGATPIVNNGTIHAHRDAVDAVIFGGAYSQVINQGKILYGATPSENYSRTTAGTDEDPFANYTPVVGISTMNTKPRTLGNEIASSSSTTENILNDTNGVIDIYETSFVTGMNVDTAQGIGNNKGKIILENRDVESVSNTIGMYLSADTKDNARITNSGSITMASDFSVGMASDSTGYAAMLNEEGGTIQSTFKRAIGMYASGLSVLRNRGLIEMKKDQNTGIYISGTADFKNESTGVIQIGAADDEQSGTVNSVKTGYGIFTKSGAKAEITNEGIINIYANTNGAGIYILGQDTVDNRNEINVFTDDTNGIQIGAVSNVSNSGNITVGTAENGVENSHAVYISETGDGATFTNDGTIDFYNSTDMEAAHGYAIYSEGNATITNNGAINLHNTNSSAIYASDGTVSNNATLNILGNNSWALEIAGNADVTNEKRGTINVGNFSSPVTNSYGIVAEEGSTGNIYNKGIISVYNEDGSYGVNLKGSASLDNSGYITTFNNNSTAVYSTGANQITNSGFIRALGANSYGVCSLPIQNTETTKTLTLTNDTEGTIILGQNGISQNGGAAISAQEITTISNYGEISVYNNNATGISATSGTSINNASTGQINLSGGSSTGINSGNVDEVTNSGSISIINTTSSGNVGILSNSGTSVENSKGGTISVNGYEAKGINVTGAMTNVTNNGTIDVIITDNEYLVTNSGMGISVANTTTLNNTGDITVAGPSGTAINSSNSSQTISITNNADLNLYTENSGIGISAVGGSKIENQSGGDISISGGTGIGIVSTGNMGSIYNAATIEINNSAGGSIGISANQGTTIENRGNIIIRNGRAVGIQANIMSGGISNYAGISLRGNNNNNIGINVLTDADVTTGADSEIIIGSYGSEAYNNYGIKSVSGNITNAGKITMYSSGSAMESGAGASLTNNGEIKLYNESSIGMYAPSGTLSNTNSIIATSTNSKALALGTNGGTLNNSGNITMSSTDGYAMYSGGNGTFSHESGTISMSGDRNIAMYSSGTGNFTNKSNIIMNGNNNSAMYSSGTGTFKNSGTITINGNNGYGIRTDSNVDTIENTGTITIDGTGGYGIYAGSSATRIRNGGTISVGRSGYGIYATNPTQLINTRTIEVGDFSTGILVNVTGIDTPVTITNSAGATITVGTSGVPIHVIKGYALEEVLDEEGQPTGEYYKDSTIINAGDVDYFVDCTGTVCEGTVSKSSNSTSSLNNIIWSDEDDTSTNRITSLINRSKGLRNNVVLLNSGTIQTAGNVDFGNGGEDGTQNVLAAGGQYVADSFSGTVHIDPSVITDDFATTYINEDSFVGENNGIEVVSDSYMFNASTEQNEAGNTNVVMSLRPFNDLVEDEDTAEYLANNYTEQRGADLFRAFRVASNQKQFNNAINAGLGLAIIPNFVKQNMDIERTLNLTIDEDIVTPSNEKYRASFNAVNFNNKVSGKHNLSGYKDNVAAVYGWMDSQAADLHIRGGLGVVLARSDSKFDENSKRYNNMAEVFAPFTYLSEDTIAMLKLKGGAGNGHYRRQGADKWYKGNTEEYYYGADTLVKHSIETGAVEVVPNVGFNLTGMYVDDVNESNGGLKIKSKNVISAQSVVGVDVAKTFDIADEQDVKLVAGGKYYHEFGDKYRAKATVDDMVGSYDMVDDRFERDFGLLSLKAKYQYKRFSIEAQANAPLEQNRNPYYLLNLGCKF